MLGADQREARRARKLPLVFLSQEGFGFRFFSSPAARASGRRPTGGAVGSYPAVRLVGTSGKVLRWAFCTPGGFWVGFGFCTLWSGPPGIPGARKFFSQP